MSASAYFNALRTLSQPIRATDLPQTLDPMCRLLDALGNPQNGFRSIVVTGSTGKGTTCLRLAHQLRARGAKVGLYTSPHLHLFRERFALLAPTARSVKAQSGAPSRLITQSEFVDLAQAVFAAQQSFDHRYSTFESATALALLWFAQQQINFAVLEIGIGGRFDAVNAVAHRLAVFTPIEAEHVVMLGGSLASVAWHKAGIIQPNGIALTVPQTPEVMRVLEREAQDKQAQIVVSTSPEQEALAALDLPAAPDLQIQPQESLPGRLETVLINKRTVIIDGGHTPAAARHLREFIGSRASIRFTVGMLRDKNVAAYLSIFDAPNVRFVYTHAPSERALTPTDLLERYQPTQASVTLIPDLDEALDQAKSAAETRSVVAGSLRMAAAAREAFGLLSPADLEEARLTRAIFDGEEYQKKLISR